MKLSIVAFVILGAVSSGANALIVFDGALDRHDLSVYRQLQALGVGLPGSTHPAGIPERIELVSDQHGYGRVAKISLGATDPLTALGRRSEIVGPFEPRETERWYAWAYFVPNSWQPTNAAISQFHETPDSWDFAAHTPTLAFQVQLDGTVIVSNAFDTNSETTRSSFEVRRLTSFDIGIGRWTTMAMHVRWSASATGFLEIFRNGETIFSEYGHPNTFNDAFGPYFKAGLYEQVRVGTGLQTMQFAGFVAGDGGETLSTISAAVPEPFLPVLWVSGLATLMVVRRRTRIRNWSVSVTTVVGRSPNPKMLDSIPKFLRWAIHVAAIKNPVSSHQSLHRAEVRTHS